MAVAALTVHVDYISIRKPQGIVKNVGRMSTVPAVKHSISLQPLALPPAYKAGLASLGHKV